VCITTYKPDTKSNYNPDHTTKKYAVVNIQLNMVTCPTYPDKLYETMSCCCTVCSTWGCECHAAP